MTTNRMSVLGKTLSGLTVVACAFLSACENGSGTSSANSTAGGETGRGGSTARMTIAGDYLYAIGGNYVQLFDISSPQAPSSYAWVDVAWDIETLFPYGDYLLIGAATGMHIMDNTVPASPQYIAEFTHAQARDPVVAHDGYAYVTLRSDGFGVANQLDVIDIRNIFEPRLVKTVGMRGPSGLTVGTKDPSTGQSELYVCDDNDGVKIFDIANPDQATVVDTIPNVNCNDILADRGILYIITDDALLQYDYTVSPPVLLSEIKETGS